MPNKPHDADVAFIRALAELLNENDLTELHVKRDYGDNDSLNVRVSRRMEAPAPISPPPAAASPVPVAAAPADAVTSPMVGTVYMQAEPGAAPFISVGERVEEGDTLLIIEAMKTMNHIPAPRSGTVRRILVEDGAAVEYGTPLVILE